MSFGWENWFGIVNRQKIKRKKKWKENCEILPGGGIMFGIVTRKKIRIERCKTKIS